MVGLALVLALLTVVCVRTAGSGPTLTPKIVKPGIGPVKQAIEERYPYRSPRFTQFLIESHVWCGDRSEHDFYAWMDKAYSECGHRFPGKEHLSLEELLNAKKNQFARITDSSFKAENEIAFSAWVHRMVKTVIPKFSLDRGFEFCEVIQTGERQCFLQSALIVGILQDVGFDAGVIMVYRNPKGEDSNNGHAVVLLKLADGRDIIVDASEPEPFYKPLGVFVRRLEYRFVNPVYLRYSSRIVAYRSESGLREIASDRVRPLDYAFVRSQFWYYRGERAPGGLLALRQTQSGLSRAQRALEQSVKFCAKNPLSVYMLGRVYLMQGKASLAADRFREAHDLYTRFGWIPGDPERYYEKTSGG